MTKVPGGLWHNFLAVQVYGANTGVGKTVFSTLLGAHFLQKRNRPVWNVQYIKPVSTGPDGDADDGYVTKYAHAPVKTLFKYPEAVSPHIAAKRSGDVPRDDFVVRRLHASLERFANHLAPGLDNMGIGIVETAGGPLSPGPSGTPQADLFRPLRLPVILVGDHRLGGISSTISAAESLTVRGYDIDTVVCFDDGGIYENSQYLVQYFFDQGIPTHKLSWIPDLKGCSAAEEMEKMQKYYKEESASENCNRLASHLMSCHKHRLLSLQYMPARTRAKIWHPFTQHKAVTNADDIMVFDSAYGDFFQAKQTRSTIDMDEAKDKAVLTPKFDGSASWWTQGLGHGNPRLALAAAYAAGRYGHVMFAGATHQPAVDLAERLLKGMGNHRLRKCFYTDNGSTAAEVGLKMALRAACNRYGWDGSSDKISILGLKGSYHGDTIGAMDASEPSVYNKNVEWYSSRGYWFDFPTVKMRKGIWFVEAPAGLEDKYGQPQHFRTLSEVFDFSKREDVASVYKRHIFGVLNHLVKRKGRRFGALIMEPILLGAGGMLFVDPLFQRILVQAVREFKFGTAKPLHAYRDDVWTGLPVVFDEVFTGLYRLGRFSAASFLKIDPDISIHAKLLTGGLLPLSATLASSSIFDTFLSDEKADALLHGHSYTAHPVGCHVANTSLPLLQSLARHHAWRCSEVRVNDQGDNIFGVHVPSEDDVELDTQVWSMWGKDTIEKLSHSEKVDHVIALGTVLAVALKDAKGAGYTSTAAIGVRDALLNSDSKNYPDVHTRVLGNVIYFMAALSSQPKQLREVEMAILTRLGL